MSELDTLTARAAELSSKADFWNNAVLWALLVTALAAAAIVVSQRLAFLRAKDLSGVQGNITRIKEAGYKLESERVAGELAAAQASLSLAEQHAAEANAKAEGFRL